VAILLKSKNLPPIPNCHNIMYLLLELFVKSRRYFSLSEDLMHNMYILVQAKIAEVLQ
jgi:hypothetical protein